MSYRRRTTVLRRRSAAVDRPTYTQHGVPQARRLLGRLYERHLYEHALIAVIAAGGRSPQALSIVERRRFRPFTTNPDKRATFRALVLASGNAVTRRTQEDAQLHGEC